MASSSSALSDPSKALAENPLEFLKTNALQFANKDVPQEYRSGGSGKAGVKLVPTPKRNVYGLQFKAVKDFDKEAVKAFVLGFKLNEGNEDVSFVDIPRKNAPEGAFLFTVGLNGCSVIVTRFDADKFRVFHDRRMDSAVLYDNVEMRVDFNDYRFGGRHDFSRTGNAITCMQFRKGGWKMFLQRHTPPLLLPKDQPPPIDFEAYAVEQKGPLTAESLEKAFNDRRTTVIQNRVKANAKNLEVDKNLIDAAKDGVVRGVEFRNDAISGWENLRKASKEQIKNQRQKEKDDLKKATTDKEKKECQRVIDAHKDTYQRYEDDVEDSELIDKTWIWLQLKKNRAKVQH